MTEKIKSNHLKSNLFWPVSLRCEQKKNPIGIDVNKPRLSWVFELSNNKLRSQKQKSYYLLVASNIELLNSNIGDVWDTGIVQSNQNNFIAYEGKSLISGQKYYWKVRIFENNRKSSKWSEVATWTMGILEESSWNGSWIGEKNNLDLEPRKLSNGYITKGTINDNDVKWVQIDLKATYSIDRIILHPALPINYPDQKHIIQQQVMSQPGFGFPKRFRFDISNKADFNKYKTIIDHTDSDYPNPGNNAQIFKINNEQMRFFRITVTKLVDCLNHEENFGFALAAIEIFSGDHNLSLSKSVSAMDSFENSGWGKSYLTCGRNLVGEEKSGHEALLMRKEIDITNQIKTANAYVCGLGLNEFFINGEKVGDEVLSPSFTDYRKRVLYKTFDVEKHLLIGKNTLGIILGGGWFNPSTPDVWGFHNASWVTTPRLLFNLIVEYKDGSNKVYSSDTTWKCSHGDIVLNCIRGGEVIDARFKKSGWDIAGYDDSKWRPVKIVDAPKGRLISESHPPIRVKKYMTPISLSEPKPGIFVYDMGINMSGWARMKIKKGKVGSKIKLFYNEKLNSDGTVLRGPHTWWHYGSYQTEEFILSNKRTEVFEPRFTYHGFRYIEVSGLTKKPHLDDLNGALVHTDLTKVGEFSCSNEDINHIQKLIIRTQLTNMHGIPTDCPHREKIGWLADGQLTVDEAVYNFDMLLFYNKWYNDILDAQENNGHVPPIAPNPGWKGATSLINGVENIPIFSDPWWGGAIIIIPWKIYKYYGDKSLLEKGFNAMESYLNWLESQSNDHIFVANLGDWLEPACFNDKKMASKEQIGTATYFYFLNLMRDFSKKLNKPKKRKKYEARANKIKYIYNNKFFDSSTGLYAKDSQLAQILPLAFGLVPKGKEKIVEKQLIKNIKIKHNNHLDTGIIGTPLLLDLLIQLGHNDLAYKIMSGKNPTIKPIL